jgi:hypothetical protein
MNGNRYKGNSEETTEKMKNLQQDASTAACRKKCLAEAATQKKMPKHEGFGKGPRCYPQAPMKRRAWHARQTKQQASARQQGPREAPLHIP